MRGDNLVLTLVLDAKGSQWQLSEIFQLKLFCPPHLPGFSDTKMFCEFMSVSPNCSFCATQNFCVPKGVRYPPPIPVGFECLTPLVSFESPSLYLQVCLISKTIQFIVSLGPPQLTHIEKSQSSLMKFCRLANTPGINLVQWFNVTWWIQRLFVFFFFSLLRNLRRTASNPWAKYLGVRDI